MAKRRKPGDEVKDARLNGTFCINTTPSIKREFELACANTDLRVNQMLLKFIKKGLKIKNTSFSSFMEETYIIPYLKKRGKYEKIKK